MIAWLCYEFCIATHTIDSTAQYFARARALNSYFGKCHARRPCRNVLRVFFPKSLANLIICQGSFRMTAAVDDEALVAPEVEEVNFGAVHGLTS